jgi:hypothetical protein
MKEEDDANLQLVRMAQIIVNSCNEKCKQLLYCFTITLEWLKSILCKLTSYQLEIAASIRLSVMVYYAETVTASLEYIICNK